MHAVPIKGMTRDLAKPDDWDEARHGKCGSLEVIDGNLPSGMPFMTSNWKPTPGELAILQEGGVVQLMVCGVVHPPVSIIATYPERP